ncbi:hypothetical protein AK812_SmicGene10719 [Symbiodinium microadriaticum]|uniref:Uncharacterized protein n=1 Tax=Symbiodinium microadriaticum TaxID=2951 RepID=A0A1Q9EF58_SYMMI|nr:hypothetical protein AK812_SmicGene10719 [Symbiodinium microadriaticum]
MRSLVSARVFEEREDMRGPAAPCLAQGAAMEDSDEKGEAKEVLLASGLQMAAATLPDTFATASDGLLIDVGDSVDRRLAAAIFALGTFAPGWPGLRLSLPLSSMPRALMIFGSNARGLLISTVVKVVGSYGLTSGRLSNVMLALINDVTAAEDREEAVGAYFAANNFMSLAWMTGIPVMLVLVLKVVDNNPVFFLILQDFGETLDNRVKVPSQLRELPGALEHQRMDKKAGWKDVLMGFRGSDGRVQEVSSVSLPTQDAEAETEEQRLEEGEEARKVTPVGGACQSCAKNAHFRELKHRSNKVSRHETTSATSTSTDLSDTDMHDPDSCCAQSCSSPSSQGPAPSPVMVMKQQFVLPVRLAFGNRRLRRLWPTLFAGFLLMRLGTWGFAGQLVMDIGGQYFNQSMGLIPYGTTQVAVLTMIPGQLLAIPGNLITGYLSKRCVLKGVAKTIVPKDYLFPECVAKTIARVCVDSFIPKPVFQLAFQFRCGGPLFLLRRMVRQS